MPERTGCRALLVDVDGVLIDSGTSVLELWDSVCDQHGRERPGVDDAVHIIGCSVDHTVGWLFPDGGPDKLRQVRSLVADREPDLGYRVLPGALEFLAGLRRHGVPVALVTGASRGRLDRVIAELGLELSARASVTWGETAGKPSPEPYRLAAQRLGVAPEECIVIEDSLAGVRSAVGAGSLCIGVAPPRGPLASAMREAGASEVTESLERIAVAGATDSPRAHQSPCDLVVNGRQWASISK